MLDAGEAAGGARAVVRVCGDVADGVDVAEALDGEGLVRLEGSVLFEADGRVVLEEIRGGRDADAEDDEVGFEGGAVLQLDGADGFRVGGGRGGRVDRGVEVEFHAVLREGVLEDLADLGAHDAFQGGGFHPHDGDGVLL